MKKIGKGYRIKNSWFPKRIFYMLFYEILDKKQLLFWIMQVNEFRMEWSRKLNLSGGGGGGYGKRMVFFRLI